MIMMGFGKVWEYDNHALNVMELGACRINI